jgi:superfamily II DNA/RNA helicase
MHRVGRSGRFGDSGLALTLFDREQDELAFWEIVDHYKMQDKVNKLDGGAKQLKELILQAKEDTIF